MSVKKPFYMKTPWNILFKIHSLKKVKPWDVNIAYLLNTFLDEMHKIGDVDFRASGIALDSSAFIYLMKSKLLLKLEDPPKPHKLPPEIMPPPIFLPLRYELTSTTIEHLLEALESVLKGERLLPLKSPTELIAPSPLEVIPQVDQYLMEIESLMESLYREMTLLARKKPILSFTEIVIDKDKLETIRTFILLLFLAQKQMIWVWQEEEFGEIYVSLKDEASFTRNVGLD